MVELRDAGLVAALGLGANEWEVCAQALQYSDFDGILLAGRYTLLEQSAVESFLPMCAERGVSVILGGTYNTGSLASDVRGAGTHYYEYQAVPENIVGSVARLEAT